MKKYIVFAAIAVAALASCKKENQFSADQLANAKVLVATNDQNIVSKTSLSSDNKVLWSTGDAVTAFVGSEKYASTSTEVSNGGLKATFTFGSLPAESVIDYTLYPADAKAEISGSVIKTTLPTLQKVVPGSFANGANLAVAKGDADVQFMNAGAFLALTIKNDNVKSIVLFSDKPMSGAVELNCEGETPVATAVTGKSYNYVQLAGDFVKDQTYHFVVLPGTYEKLSVEITDKDGRKATYTNPATLSVARNESLDIAEFTVPEGKWEAPAIKNAVNMKQARLYPKWEGEPVGTVSAFTLETLVKYNSFNHDSSTKVYNLMGIEGQFNVRVRRDISGASGPNIIQISNSVKLDLKSKPLDTDKWYHVAVVFNNGAVDAYIDGKLEGHSDNIGASSINLSPKWSYEQSGAPRCFWYGYAYDAGRWFDGQMSEMRIWNKALTAEDIAAPGHFYFVDPTSEGLFSYWPATDAKGNTIADATGRGNILYGDVNVTTPTTNNPGINWAEDLAHSISVDTASKSIAMGGENFTVAVTAVGNWTVSGATEWCTLSQTSGSGDGSVEVTVAANDGAARTATLTFTCGTHTASVAVSQEAYVSCPPLTIAASSAVKTPDVFIGASDKSSDAYVATVPGATVTWTIDDNGDAWTASCSPASEGFSYNAAAHTITLVIPETATATAINKWEIVASKTGDEGNAPLVLTAAQQCYTRYTLTAAGEKTKFGYVPAEVTANDQIVEGTYVIAGFWQEKNTYFFLQNLWRTPHTEAVYSSNMKLMTDYFGKKTLLQDLQGGDSGRSEGKINQSCSSTFFDLVSVGEGKFAIRPYGCNNLGLGEDAAGNLVIGPEYKDCAWSFSWGGVSATGRWDITLGEHHLNVEDSCTDVTGSANQRQIKIKSSKGSHCFKVFKVNM